LLAGRAFPYSREVDAEAGAIVQSVRKDNNNNAIKFD
jgi:hypothetical protein